MRAIHTMTSFSSWAAIVLAAATLAAGCARTMHRRDGFGVANHTFFDRQAQAATSGGAQGLDPEEAAMIHARYRETLGGRTQATGKGDARGSSVLILQEESDAGNKRKD